MGEKAQTCDSEISLDAAAIALLRPRQLIWLLCATMKHDQRGMVEWFQGAMGELATELFTDSLEAPLQDEAVDMDTAQIPEPEDCRSECPPGRVALGTFAASVEVQLSQTAAHMGVTPHAIDAPSKEVSGISGSIDELFNRVYSMLDAETLLQKLERRKQSFREGLIAEIRNALV